MLGCDMDRDDTAQDTKNWSCHVPPDTAMEDVQEMKSVGLVPRR